METMDNRETVDGGHEWQWMEDFDDLTVDDLRELPHHLQLGMDLAVYE